MKEKPSYDLDRFNDSRRTNLRFGGDRFEMWEGPKCHRMHSTLADCAELVCLYEHGRLVR